MVGFCVLVGLTPFLGQVFKVMYLLAVEFDAQSHLISSYHHKDLQEEKEKYINDEFR